MNSSATSNGWSTSPECEIYHFLGEKLDQPTTNVYLVFAFIIVVHIITCPATTVLNTLVLIAVKIKRQLRTMSNIALACLVLTDALMGLIGQPMFIAVAISTLRGEASSEICTLQRLARNTVRLLVAASLFHLVLLSVERYLAIKHSLEYQTMVTEARILGSSAIMWFIVALHIPLIAAGEDIYLPVSNAMLFLVVAVIIFCQVAVYFETRRHEKVIAAQQVSLEARQKFLKEKKAFKLTSTIIFILVLNTLPLFLTRILLVKSVINSKGAKFVAYFTSNFVLVLNSLVNPIVYCLRVRHFRVEFIEIVFRKNNAQAEEIEMRIFGSLNAVAPLEGVQAEEGRNNRHNKSNSINNNNNNNSGSKNPDNNCNNNNDDDEGNRDLGEQQHQE